MDRIASWRDDSPPVDIGAGEAGPGRKRAGELFRAGFLISISNPKALIFAAAFFPQFVHADQPKTPQFGILLVTFIVIEMSWYMTYAIGGRTLARYLREAHWQRRFNRASGVLFMLFGVALLAWRQN